MDRSVLSQEQQHVDEQSDDDDEGQRDEDRLHVFLHRARRPARPRQDDLHEGVTEPVAGRDHSI